MRFLPATDPEKLSDLKKGVVFQVQWLLEGCVAARLRDERPLVALVDRLQELYNRHPDPRGLTHLCTLVQQLRLQFGHPFLDTFCPAMQQRGAMQ